MNKSDLIGAMAGQAGVSNKDAGACLDAFFEVVAAEVAAGDAKVSVPGWISFEQVIRAARKGRNPQTGEEIQVAATRACKVSVGPRRPAGEHLRGQWRPGRSCCALVGSSDEPDQRGGAGVRRADDRPAAT